MNWERGDEAAFAGPQALEAGAALSRAGRDAEGESRNLQADGSQPHLSTHLADSFAPSGAAGACTGSQAKFQSLQADGSQPRVRTGSQANPTAAEAGVGRQRHICIVTETYPPEINGVALTLGHLAQGLRGIGHRVTLVRPWQQAVDRAEPANRRGGMSHYDGIEKMLVRGMPLPGYRGLQIGWPAGRRLREAWTYDRPDVVYVATEGPLGWSAVCSARSLKIPAFSGFHTNYDIYARHYRLGRLQNLVFKYLRLLHNRTDGTLVASSDLCTRLEQCGFKGVKVLGRGVDNRLFAPERRSADLRRHWGVAEGELAALYVGRLAPEKNVRLAIDAYQEMKRCNAASKFILVGDGPIRGELQAEHPGLGFAGTQTGESLACHYASADIFLFPSETETFGNVTLEAMASGLAVVAYDYAAARIHIRHRETGWLVPFGDAQGFIESATGLTRERGVLEQIRRQAREYTAAVDWTKVVDRFDALLQGSTDQGVDSDSLGGTLADSRAHALASEG